MAAGYPQRLAYIDTAFHCLQNFVDTGLIQQDVMHLAIPVADHSNI